MSHLTFTTSVVLVVPADLPVYTHTASPAVYHTATFRPVKLQASIYGAKTLRSTSLPRRLPVVEAAQALDRIYQAYTSTPPTYNQGREVLTLLVLLVHPLRLNTPIICLIGAQLSLVPPPLRLLPATLERP